MYTIKTIACPQMDDLVGHRLIRMTDHDQRRADLLAKEGPCSCYRFDDRSIGIGIKAESL
jgi:hypothetical protein